ncbi:ABC transporter permease [Streptomyces yaizuensis]|uniref:ABC transporter permease n=1 Tax=Streptomyces yaizuensis TaxID=2989713 RepID=A0ABQ5P2Q1_9ACTN|nr:ABC transporter permease [Streptomyces sp. YSPA8]GLF96819.1 ABC transporter permease [Streptomyces sp. YSPA8]
MSFTAVLHSEWIKVTSVRAVLGTLLAVPAVSLAVTVLVLATTGASDAYGDDPVHRAFYAIGFAQIAAVAFGTSAVAAEYAAGALRISLAAVPRRGVFYAAKTAVVAGAALGVGLLTSFASFFAGQAFLGEDAIGLGTPGALRACVGAGIHLALMSALAAGLTCVLRRAALVLGLLIPAFLILPFVISDVAGSAVRYLPDRAGQQILHQDPAGGPGAWTGLTVTALWAAAALLAGWAAVRRRDT